VPLAYYANRTSRCSTLSLHDALPILRVTCGWARPRGGRATILPPAAGVAVLEEYRHRHPIATRLLAPALDLPELEATEPIPEERSEEHTSELQSVAISYAVFCLKKKK